MDIGHVNYLTIC